MSFPFFLTPSQGGSLPSQTDPFYDLYRYYIDLVVRFNVYYFAVLGALLTFAASTDAIAKNYLLLAIPLLLSILQFLNYILSLNLSNEIHKGKVSFLWKATVESKITNSNPGSSYLKSNPLYNILLSFIIVHLFLIVFLGWAMWHYYAIQRIH